MTLFVALVVAAVALVIVAGLLYAAGAARARVLADEVRSRVEPYLRRKAAECGIPADTPRWTPRSLPEEIVGYSVRLAGELLERERSGLVDPAALAQTQPVSPSEELRNDLARRR